MASGFGSIKHDKINATISVTLFQIGGWYTTNNNNAGAAPKAEMFKLEIIQKLK